MVIQIRIKQKKAAGTEGDSLVICVPTSKVSDQPANHTHVTMEDYCGSRFWDPALSWNTTDLFLGPCVEETAVALAPVAFLLVFGFIDVLNVRRSKCRLPLAPSSVNPFVLVKTLLSTALVAVYLAHLARLAALPSESTTYFDVDWVAPSLQLAGYVRRGLWSFNLLLGASAANYWSMSFFFTDYYHNFEPPDASVWNSLLRRPILLLVPQRPRSRRSLQDSGAKVRQ